MVNFNIPEFTDGKVNLDPIKIRDVLYTDGMDVKFDSTVDVDALSGSTWIETKQDTTRVSIH